MNENDLRVFEAVGQKSLIQYGYEVASGNPTLSPVEVFLLSLCSKSNP